MTRHYIPIFFTKPAIHAALNKDRTTTLSLLKEFNIDSNTAIEPKHYAHFIRNLWLSLEDESGGFCETAIPPGSFALACDSALHANNLRRALMRVSRAWGIISKELSIELEEHGFEAQLHINVSQPTRSVEPIFLQQLALIWWRFAEWLIKQKILLSRLELPSASPKKHPLKQLFKTTIYFSEPHTTLVFDRRLLNLPIQQDSESLSLFLAEAPASLISPDLGPTSLSQQVRSIIKMDIESASLEGTAEQLELSVTTLRRHLKEEGNHFQDIKDQVRHQAALRLIKNTTLSMDDIAERMGFSEASALSRAFKRWTGYPPSYFR